MKTASEIMVIALICTTTLIVGEIKNPHHNWKDKRIALLIEGAKLILEILILYSYKRENGAIINILSLLLIIITIFNEKIERGINKLLNI